MFETEVEEWADEMYPCDGQAQQYLIMGAEFGYNKANEYAITIIQDLLDNSDEYARQRAYEYLDRPCATCRHKAKMLTDEKPCKDCDNGCNWEK